MRALRTSRRDKRDGFPGAGGVDVSGEEDGINITPCFFQMWWRNCEEIPKICTTDNT